MDFFDLLFEIECVEDRRGPDIMRELGVAAGRGDLDESCDTLERGFGVDDDAVHVR